MGEICPLPAQDMVYAGTNSPSFACSVVNLPRIAELPINEFDVFDKTSNSTLTVGIENIKLTDMAGCRPLTGREIERVLAAFSGKYALRDRAMFLLGVLSGFRIHEILSLKVADVVDADGKVVNYITVERRHMKGARSSRTCPLHPRAGKVIVQWIQAAGLQRDDALFASRQGGPITVCRAWGILKAAFRRAGLTGRLGTHTMRKTFAQRIHQALGGDLHKTSKALGHRNVATTIRYLECPEVEIRKAVLSL